MWEGGHAGDCRSPSARYCIIGGIARDSFANRALRWLIPRNLGGSGGFWANAGNAGKFKGTQRNSAGFCSALNRDSEGIAEKFGFLSGLQTHDRICTAPLE